jgi:uncharacterized protein YkwD
VLGTDRGDRVFLLSCVADGRRQEGSSQWLAAHNSYRKLHGAPPVVWSEKVASSAQAHAETCPSGHSGLGYGENLAWASYELSVSGVVKMWYDEEALYDYANPGFTSGAGHFTQIIWKETTEIGCAHVTGCGSDSSLKANTWVCGYNPPGNYLRQFPGNVFPPLSKR